MKTTKGPLASTKVEACDDPEKSAVPERSIDSSETLYHASVQLDSRRVAEYETIS